MSVANSGLALNLVRKLSVGQKWALRWGWEVRQIEAPPAIWLGAFVHGIDRLAGYASQKHTLRLRFERRNPPLPELLDEGGGFGASMYDLCNILLIASPNGPQPLYHHCYVGRRNLWLGRRNRQRACVTRRDHRRLCILFTKGKARK